MKISRDQTEVMVISREPIQCDIELDGELWMEGGGCKEDVKAR